MAALQPGSGWSLDGATIKKAVIGDYDWSWLCAPQWPWCRTATRRQPPFYAVHERTSLLVTLVMGFQHSLAMVGGIITPALLIGQSANNPVVARYLVSSSLTLSGILSAFLVLQLSIPYTRYKYGTGIVTVTGTAITHLQTYLTSIAQMQALGYTWDEAYGKMLGTTAVCAFLTIGLSFLPPRTVRRIFPPIVSGVSVFLLGAGLISVGIKAWGGGSFCADNDKGILGKPYPCLVANPAANNTLTKTSSCYSKPVLPLCTGNGDVKLLYGSPEYLALGGVVFFMLVVVELFGSPFIQNCEIVIALLVGYVVAAISTKAGNSFVSTAQVDAAPAITFLWTSTFPLGFYAPAVLPLLAGFVVITLSDMGDITASEEASLLETSGPSHERRIQGGMLADGCNSIFSTLAMTLPQTIFSQNNGVIFLTRCASRNVGFGAAFWLVVFGILAKVGAFFNSIPNCVLGGMTTFLFTSVMVSGIRVMTLTADSLNRRSRFIIAISLGVGLGVTLVPDWATNALWPVNAGMSSGVRGLRDAVIQVVSSGYTIGTFLALLLNLVVPHETDEPGALATEAHDDNYKATVTTQEQVLAKLDASLEAAPAQVMVVEVDPRNANPHVV